MAANIKDALTQKLRAGRIHGIFATSQFKPLRLSAAI
jgi:hypothetical protein